MHVNSFHICYSLLSHLLHLQPLPSLHSCYTSLLNAPVVKSFNIQKYPRGTLTQIIYTSIHNMSQAPQPQPVFVDIHRNNGPKFKFEMFKYVLKGRLNNESIMQLAFEQFLADCKFYGTCRTYRYAIVNGDMFLLHSVFNPSPAGPAVAAPVMQPGLQSANGQTQASGDQNPYASQLKQPVSNFLGPFDHSMVQDMHYTPASTAQRSASQPQKLNPHASEFKVGSAVNNHGASASLSALPRANTAPARPPGLLETRQPHFAPANSHRGFFAPDALYNARHGHGYQDTIPRSLYKDREAATALATPQTLITPCSPILRSTIPKIPQQPQPAPFNPNRVLTLNSRLGLLVDTAIPASLKFSPSPPGLAAKFSSSARQRSRRNSEYCSDTPSFSSSDQPESPVYYLPPESPGSYLLPLSSPGQPEIPGFRRFGHRIRVPLPPVRPISRFGWSSYPTTATSQGLQNGAAETAPWDPWDPLSEYMSGKHKDFYTHVFRIWYKTAPPNSNVFDFLTRVRSLSDSYREYHDRFGLRRPEGPFKTAEPWASIQCADGYLRHKGYITGVNAKEVAKLDELALRTQRWVASNIAAPILPTRQLHNGEEGIYPGESSSSNLQPAVRGAARSTIFGRGREGGSGNRVSTGRLSSHPLQRPCICTCDGTVREMERTNSNLT